MCSLHPFHRRPCNCVFGARPSDHFLQFLCLCAGGVGWGGVGWAIIAFICMSRHTSRYTTVGSLALPHIRLHATLLDVLLHFHTYFMLRCCTFSCVSTHKYTTLHSCYRIAGHTKVSETVLANADSMGVASNAASTRTSFVSAEAESFAGWKVAKRVAKILLSAEWKYGTRTKLCET